MLSFRLRHRTPERWDEFSRLWMAFNAIYGGEPDARERARVMAVVRRFVSSRDAQHLLDSRRNAIAELIAVPPGDMRREAWDPRFRAASRKYARRYRDRKSGALARLAAVAGITYQVRCNLLHGSKDPDSARDRMLVRASVDILRDLVPVLERGIAHASMSAPAV